MFHHSNYYCIALDNDCAPWAELWLVDLHVARCKHAIFAYNKSRWYEPGILYMQMFSSHTMLANEGMVSFFQVRM